jgi:hypothetical protein
VEHGFFLDDEAIGLMLDRGTRLVPTLSAGEGTRAAGDPPDVVGLGDRIRAVHQDGALAAGSPAAAS